ALVVVRVVQQAQVREQVDDLLLAEVPAARRAVGRQPERAQLLLVPLGIGARREQEHDLPWSRRARLDELGDAAGDPARLCATPVLAGVTEAALVRDEQ